VAALFAMISGGLLASGSDIQSTNNYRFSTQALYAAESGLLHAVKTINGPGVVNYQNEVVDLWPTVFGSGPRTFGSATGFIYTVVPVATPWDTADPANRGTLRAIAFGPFQTRTAVVSRVTRSNLPNTSPGAIYLANDNPTDAEFQGDSFTVDGNDRNFTGGDGPGEPVPGISTRNASNTNETIASLDEDQVDNVTGLGFNPGPPITPSVQMSPVGPDEVQLNRIIDELLTRPRVDCPENIINNHTACTYGTPEAPQITYMSNAGGIVVRGNGNIDGAGILIIEGNLTVQGTLDFKGLVLVRGPTEISYDEETNVTGNATVYGSLWTTDLSLNVGGSAIVQYSTQALQLADASGGGGALPAPVTIAGLVDCSVVPAATNGCP
jgi:hypothetical protein